MPRLSLSDITEFDAELACPDGLVTVRNRVLARRPTGTRKIPRVVHQTSRSRYVTPRLAELMKTWRLPDHDYYLHDDAAVEWLLTREEWPMFPHLASVVSCITQGTLRADLWRYLVLYEYGGIYADIDSTPKIFDGSQIGTETDAFFIVDGYQTLSQYFMAVAPRHPILYYTIHDALIHLLQAPDVAGINAAFQTGPHALHRGFQAFMQDAGVDIPNLRRGRGPLVAGTYVGTEGRSITALGSPSNENELVVREAIHRAVKIREYQRMGMRHFTQEIGRSSGVSLIRAMFQAQKKQGIL